MTQFHDWILKPSVPQLDSHAFSSVGLSEAPPTTVSDQIASAAVNQWPWIP